MRNLRTNLLIFIYHEIMEKKKKDFFQEKNDGESPSKNCF